MAQISIEMPDDFKSFIDKKVNDGAFETPSDFLQALIAREVRVAEIEEAVLEAEEEIQRGECTEWHPGDTQKRFEQLLRERRQKNTA